MARKITTIGRFNHQVGYQDRGEWTPSYTYPDGYLKMGEFKQKTKNGRNVGQEFVENGLMLPFRNIRIRDVEKEMMLVDQFEMDLKIAVPNPPMKIREQSDCLILDDEDNSYKVVKVEDNNNGELTLFLLKRKGIKND